MSLPLLWIAVGIAIYLLASHVIGAIMIAAGLLIWILPQINRQGG